MSPPLDATSSFDPLAEGPSDPSTADGKADPLSTPAALIRLHKLEEWYEVEKIRQAPNRYQMAIDDDFYDGLQWAEEDAEVLLSRKQAPLVYNKVATNVKWITGTEKRTRMDFKVFPRSSNDRNGAENKTKVLKYLQDVNKAQYSRSRAFADAVKVGLGWLECGIRSDPSKELIYDRAESWRNVWYDSHGVEIDGTDDRYVFRQKWTDLDIAQMCFPQYKNSLKAGSIFSDVTDNQDEDGWYLGRSLSDRNRGDEYIGRRTFVDTTSSLFNRRSRVRLTEAWYRMPMKVKLIIGSGLHGVIFDPNDDYHDWLASQKACSLIDRMMLRVRVAIFMRGKLLYDEISPYRHNQFPLTPIWGNRRARDNAPYGVIRLQRDPQEDFNKRMSKALHQLSATRVFMEGDKNSVDLEEVREEAARPDSVFVYPKGLKFELKTDTDIAEHHLAYAQIDERMIQDVGGVTDELMGRKTNAISGKAIQARQDQGSTVTTDYFDGYRLAFQLHGQKELSLAEQFMTDQRSIRIIGERRGYDFLEINQPGTDKNTGQPMLMNDITKDQADFIVSAQDFRESMRQAAYESLMDMVTKMPPELGIKLLADVLEFADLPGAEALISTVREITGQAPRDKVLTPEEEQQVQAAKQKQAQDQQMLQDLTLKGAEAKVDETVSKVRLLGAQADLAEAQATALGTNGSAQYQQQIAKIRDDTSKLVASLVDQVRQAQLKYANRSAEIERKYSTQEKIAQAKNANEQELEQIRQNAETEREGLRQDTAKETSAMEASNQEKIDALQGTIDVLHQQLQLAGDKHKAAVESGKTAVQLATQAAAVKKTATGTSSSKPASKPAAASPNVGINITPAQNEEPTTTEKNVDFKFNPAGKITGLIVKETKGKKAK